jgi:hypothetical protein
MILRHCSDRVPPRAEVAKWCPIIKSANIKAE